MSAIRRIETNGFLFDIDLEEIQSYLIAHGEDYGHAILTEPICFALCHLALKIFQTEANCLQLEPPLWVVGDIHGQLKDLIRIFDEVGYPPLVRFLFLGDYVDRGDLSLEVISLLFVLKIRYPSSLILLRGNHESSGVNKRYGFKDECQERFKNENIYLTFNNVFNYMPICAIVAKKLFCAHGGISRNFFNYQPGQQSLIKNLNGIENPIKVKDVPTVCDILWSDPVETTDNSKESMFQESSRGCSEVFTKRATELFLRRFDLEAIIRAHQVIDTGFMVSHNRLCITVFSAPNYCKRYNNAGSVIFLKKISTFMSTAKYIKTIKIVRFTPELK